MKKILFLILCLLLANIYTKGQDGKNICVEENKAKGGVVRYPEPIDEKKSKKLRAYRVDGFITDADGSALPGAIISYGENNQTLTDSVGRFSINIKGNKPAIIQVDYMGYHNLKVAIGPEYNQKALHIVLKEQDVDLPVIMIRKPAIYLYPETRTKIAIKHHFKGEVLNTYPAYNDGWVVIAEPNGKLKNEKDNRNYSYLFWDGIYTFPQSHYNYKDGFYVAQKDYVSFLQEKLEKIGLNETEINDFIVFWLPVLSEYEESFIHFRINDDIGHSSILEVSPKPDTMLRVFMEFKQYDEDEAKLPEQRLPSFSRTKFTLIEWGGGEINSQIVN